jgi:hypothetical protein
MGWMKRTGEFCVEEKWRDGGEIEKCVFKMQHKKKIEEASRTAAALAVSN